VDLCSLIERNAAFAPDKPAIHFEGNTLSYAAFAARIEQTARALKAELGVNRGDRVAILSEGELRKLDSVKNLLEDVLRLELRATGVQLNDDLKRDLEAVLTKHGGKIEFIGHPTTTLEALFLRIIEESKAHPGRRYMPDAKTDAAPVAPTDGKTAAPGDTRIKK